MPQMLSLAFNPFKQLDHEFSVPRPLLQAVPPSHIPDFVGLSCSGGPSSMSQPLRHMHKENGKIYSFEYLQQQDKS